MLAVPLSGRWHLQVHLSKGLLGNTGTKGLWGKKCRIRRRWFPNNPLTGFTCVSPTLPIHEQLPHLSLISESLKLSCSVKRLPADTQHQIKSFTVKSKEFSLYLHKHESVGGSGLLSVLTLLGLPAHFGCVCCHIQAPFFLTQAKLMLYTLSHLNLNGIFCCRIILMHEMVIEN